TLASLAILSTVCTGLRKGCADRKVMFTYNGCVGEYGKRKHAGISVGGNVRGIE
ncbi:7383_t:CDS:1, partial [Paraglomus occultum]